MRITHVYPNEERITVDPDLRRVKIFLYASTHASFWTHRTDDTWKIGGTMRVCDGIDYNDYTFYGKILECNMYSSMLTDEEITHELNLLRNKYPGCECAIKEAGPIYQIMIYEVKGWKDDDMKGAIPNDLVAICKRDIDPLFKAIIESAMVIKSVAPINPACQNKGDKHAESE